MKEKKKKNQKSEFLFLFLLNYYYRQPIANRLLSFIPNTFDLATRQSYPTYFDLTLSIKFRFIDPTKLSYFTYERKSNPSIGL